MTLEPIRRRRFSEPDRAEVQETIARAVESGPERFFERYARLPQSFGGRFISADLFKETFEPYRRSKETRDRYNVTGNYAASGLRREVVQS